MNYIFSFIGLVLGMALGQLIFYLISKNRGKNGRNN